MDLDGVDVAVRDKVFPCVGDGLDKLGDLLGANELDVLLVAEGEF